MILFAATAHAFETRDADLRRTGQADVVGPASAADVRSVALPDEQKVNMPVVFEPDGTLLVGTWGMIRSYGSEDRATWDKMDGKLFRIAPDLSIDRVDPLDPLPYCYEYEGRSDPGICGDSGTQIWYNGTVEGTPTVTDGVITVGRGDGKVYAIEAATGDRRWTFETFDPEDPADPDGGGEVIGGTLVLDGTVYFATAGMGPYETNAVYAVDLETGALVWRWPATGSSWSGVFWAPLATSPDGTRIYVGSQQSGSDPAGSAVLAFERDGTLAWTADPVALAKWWLPRVGVQALAVGADGTIYATGFAPDLIPITGDATVLALTPDGAPAWPAMQVVPEGTFSYGLALREEGGVTTRVYATSGSTPLFGVYADGGTLMAYDPGTGEPLWTAPFDPSDHGGAGGMHDVAIDADGNLYANVTGLDAGGVAYSLDPDGNVRWSVAVDGQIEWSYPVLGPSGEVAFADSRLCPDWPFYPLEDGECPSETITPLVYVVGGGAGGGGTTSPTSGTPTGDPTSGTTASPPGGAGDPDGGCACASPSPGSASAGDALLVLLWIARRRRPARSAVRAPSDRRRARRGTRGPAPSGTPPRPDRAAGSCG